MDKTVPCCTLNEPLSETGTSEVGCDLHPFEAAGMRGTDYAAPAELRALGIECLASQSCERGAPTEVLAASISTVSSTDGPPLRQSRKGKHTPADDGFRIVQNKFARKISAKTPRNRVPSFRENRLAVSVIMGIGSEHVNCIIFQQPH